MAARILHLLFFLALICASQSLYAQEKYTQEKFNRALVFSGGGFQTGMFLGMMAGAESKGLPPDVIIASCGGSVAAAVVNAFPTNEQRLKFVESREFYELLKSVEFTSYGTPLGLMSFLKTVHGANLYKTIPDIFNVYLAKMPNFSQLSVGRPFGKSPRIVIVGSKILFSEDEVGQKKNQRKLFEEVFFTDPETGAMLQGFQSPIGKMKGSTVASQTDVVLDAPILDAVRASITDPFLTSPEAINGTYYLTGAVDLYPLEVADHLAKEVIMPVNKLLDPFIAEPVLSAAYGMKNNERLRDVTGQYARYWLDQSDSRQFFKKDTFFPTIELPGYMRSRIPQDYDEYVKRVRRQWEFGFQRATEAVLAQANDQSHIRNVIKHSVNCQKSMEEI